MHPAYDPHRLVAVGLIMLALWGMLWSAMRPKITPHVVVVFLACCAMAYGDVWLLVHLQ